MRPALYRHAGKEDHAGRAAGAHAASDHISRCWDVCMPCQLRQDLVLHADNFGPVAARDRWEFLWTRRDSQFGEQPLKIRNAILCHSELLVIVIHVRTSTIPRRVPPRLGREAGIH